METVWMCGFKCGFNSNEEETVKNHQNFEHGLKCKICKFATLDFEVLERHMINLHNKPLTKKTFNSRKDYNQIANFVYTQSEINISIKDKPPFEYFGEVLKQCDDGPVKYGAITDMEVLKTNMKQNCIPESVFDMSIESYHDFLKQRRKLIAKKIENYYKSF